METATVEKPWELLSELLATDDSQKVQTFLKTLNPADTAWVVSRLPPAEQNRLLTLLDPEDAAEVIEDISDPQAAEIIEELQPELAAARSSAPCRCCHAPAVGSHGCH